MTKWILLLALVACQTAPRSMSSSPAPATAELAARRAQMIAWLRDYGEAGVYPTDALGRPTSVFRDAKGVRCPMAELIHRSGRADLVDQVVTTNNKLRLADVEDGALHDWMMASGLTIEEIAMVQGVPEFNYGQLQFQVESTNQVILAKGQMRGRIDMAVAALGKDSEHSVNVAATRLAKQRPTRATRRVATGKGAPILRQ
jgi:hypothetical protein